MILSSSTSVPPAAPNPVTALRTWLDTAAIDDGPVLRPVSKGNRALHAESVNDLVQAAVARAGLDPAPYSAHCSGLRHRPQLRHDLRQSRSARSSPTTATPRPQRRRPHASRRFVTTTLQSG